MQHLGDLIYTYTPGTCHIATARYGIGNNAQVYAKRETRRTLDCGVLLACQRKAQFCAPYFLHIAVMNKYHLLTIDIIQINRHLW